MSNKLTKLVVEKIPFTVSGQKLFFDSELPGFGLRVGRTRKTYFVRAESRGRTIRSTVGPHPLYTPETARKEARGLLLKIMGGENPNAEKRAAKFRDLALRDAFERYVEFHPDLMPNSRRDYEHALPLYFDDWQDRPLRDIVPKMEYFGH